MTTADTPVAFAEARHPRSLGDGTFTATLRSEWSIGGHPHGGFITALLARTATSVLSGHNELGGDPLAVSAEFLRATELGPVLLRTELRKVGRRTTVVGVRLEQRGRSCVEAHVLLGRLPEQRATSAELPVLPAEPPANAITLADHLGDGVFRLAQDCEVRIDASTAGFLTGKKGRPAGSADPSSSLRMRLWARPRSADVDVYFALLAGDINPPVPFNLGRKGWSPTVQMTSYLRTTPAPGWMRIQVDCEAVYGNWFDSSATVLDSAGQLICQSRQLAITPGPA
ncbi:Thioesterase-like superfamily protein [Haloechinothrix alba]|uniref:Thioesterase-like superfamily protein n=1 Tax=Haloechinothrix alba TaxID=664784 RepID=A0A238W1B6_9PSEU|nr:thioesterase family protein [Haloechinothrix alba]SNR40288.1 Thioesterase-like superfamily protein [Haloechinothrix alba]